MSNDRNTEHRNGNKQQSDSLTTVVFEELSTDDIDEVAGGANNCMGCACCSPPRQGDCGGHPSSGCFVPGTLIRMADGSSKPIEEVEIGDQVLAYDDRVREVVPSRVAHKFVHPDIDDGLIRINGRLEATPYHVIHADGRYMRVDELKIGSMLLALSEAGVARTEPTVVSSLERFHRKQTVYNLEIERQHTFFANGILVHNAKVK